MATGLWDANEPNNNGKTEGFGDPEEDNAVMLKTNARLHDISHTDLQQPLCMFAMPGLRMNT